MRDCPRTLAEWVSVGMAGAVPETPTTVAMTITSVRHGRAMRASIEPSSPISGVPERPYSHHSSD